MAAVEEALTSDMVAKGDSVRLAQPDDAAAANGGWFTASLGQLFFPGDKVAVAPSAESLLEHVVGQGLILDGLTLTATVVGRLHVTLKTIWIDCDSKRVRHCPCHRAFRNAH